MKGEALRLLSENSSQTAFEVNISNFAAGLKNRGYPAATVVKHLSEVKFSERETSLTNKDRTARKKILPFATQYHLALPNLKGIHSWEKSREARQHSLNSAIFGSSIWKTGTQFLSWPRPHVGTEPKVEISQMNHP